MSSFTAVFASGRPFCCFWSNPFVVPFDDKPVSLTFFVRPNWDNIGCPNCEDPGPKLEIPFCPIWEYPIFDPTPIGPTIKYSACPNWIVQHSAKINEAMQLQFLYPEVPTSPSLLQRLLRPSSLLFVSFPPFSLWRTPLVWKAVAFGPKFILERHLSRD